MAMSLRCTVALVAAGLAAPAFAAPAKHPAPAGEAHERTAGLEERLAHLEAELARRPLDVSAYQLPEKLDLCGERIDLSDPVVRERMEQDFYLMLGDRAQVVLWVKRARRFFPAVDAETKAQDTCSDLRYLAVIESGLRPAVASRASAVGWWQFMAPTARAYGLDVDGVWDDRADLQAATHASVSFLKDLHDQFGSWSLAFAAYNTGPGRLQNAIDAQGTKDYWHLDLVSEAEHYVPRIAAAKAIFENLEGYGFAINVADGYAPEATAQVDVSAARTVPLPDVARRSGVPVYDLRRLNPQLAGDVLPGDRKVAVRVPKGSEGRFLDAIQALAADAKPERRVATRAADRGRPAEKPKHYTVQAGDSLWDIAQAHEVTIQDLRKWNSLGSRDVLKPGQRIVVRR
jgi:LysM repeat protein